MRALIPFFLTVLVCSCSATLPTKREPVKAQPGQEQELESAKSLIQAGESRRAQARLKKIVNEHPDSDVADDAHFLMGQMHFNAQQFSDAYNNFDAIIKSPVASPLETEAVILAVRSLLKLSRVEEAEKLLERLTYRGSNLNAQQKLQFHELSYEVNFARQKYKEALKALVALADAQTSPAEQEKWRATARDLMDSRLSEEDLEDVATNRDYTFLQAPAKYRYGILLAERRQYSRARGFFAEVAELVPGTELGERAANLVQQLDARSRVNSKTIGVILPLSGKQAGIGYKALRGIQLGLGIYGKNRSNFRLAVIDSEGSPEAARRGVERLVQEDNVIAIIGGLLSKTATTEASKAQEFGVPAIMLSQRAGITQAGDFVFRNALTSQMQVQRIVDLAMGKFAYKKFAIMYPNDAYGVEFANLFWDEVKARGGAINGAQPYDPNETDFRGHVQRLVGTFYSEDRADEYRLRSKAWAEKNPKRSARQGAPGVEDLLPPITDFDALFIPDSARAVGQIAPMIAYNNVTGVRLLGTNLWNSTSLITRGQKFVEGAIFVDSFLAADPSFQNSEFFTNFKSTFEEEPGLTELQAYDSALVLRQLIAGGETSRQGLQQRMASLENFPGAMGRLSATPSREFRRPLSALTIKDAKIVDLEAARQ